MSKSQPILIVEDERDVAFSMKEFLEDQGYTIEIAADGARGLARMRELQPLALLLDLRLPLLDGLEVLKHATSEFPEMPVIVVSGKGMITDVVAALRLGAWDYLIKPLDEMEILAHSLTRAMDRAKLMRDNREYREHLEEEVQRRTTQLELANQALEGKQMALREVLGTVEGEKRAIGEQVVANVEKIVMPMVRSLKEGLTRGQKKIIEHLETALEEIVSPFTDKLSRQVSSLTPAEVRICNLVRNGLGVKEIADIERIAPETVGAHRRNIRRKLGVAHKKINLTTYLRTLTHTGNVQEVPDHRVSIVTHKPQRPSAKVHQ